MGYLAMARRRFFGLGAYVVGNLTTLRFEENYWLALLAVVPINAAVAYVLSFPLFRLPRLPLRYRHSRRRPTCLSHLQVLELVYRRYFRHKRGSSAGDRGL